MNSVKKTHDKFVYDATNSFMFLLLRHRKRRLYLRNCREKDESDLDGDRDSEVSERSGGISGYSSIDSDSDDVTGKCWSPMVQSRGKNYI